MQPPCSQWSNMVALCLMRCHARGPVVRWYQRNAKSAWQENTPSLEHVLQVAASFCATPVHSSRSAASGPYAVSKRASSSASQEPQVGVALTALQ